MVQQVTHNASIWSMMIACQGPGPPLYLTAIQDEPTSSAGFQMTSHRWPSGSWKYPE
jgi:hypothetical protein